MILVCKQWQTLMECDLIIDWSIHINYYLEQIADRYLSLYVQSMQNEPTLMNGMRTIFKKRASKLYEKIRSRTSSSSSRNNQCGGESSSKQVLIGILSHEWFYLFHSFCKRFDKISPCLSRENVYEILFRQDTTYCIHYCSMETCTRYFLENFAKLSRIHAVQVNRVMTSGSANKYMKKILDKMNYNIEILEYFVENFNYLENVSVIRKLDISKMSTHMKRVIFKRFYLPSYSDLSKVFNLDFELLEIAIEQVSNRDAKGVYSLLKSSQEIPKLFEIENSQLSDFIAGNYNINYLLSHVEKFPKLENYILSRTNEPINSNNLQTYAKIFFRKNSLPLSKSSILKRYIMSLLKNNEISKLKQLITILKEKRGLSKFRSVELDLTNDGLLLLQAKELNDGRRFLLMVKEFTDYNICENLIEKLSQGLNH